MFFVLLFFTNCVSTLCAKAQSFNLADHKKRVTIPFKMVRNMVVIELKINNNGPYNFILDTGVGLMVITEPRLVDSINISYKKTVQLYGLGDGESFEAYIASSLNISMPDVYSNGIGAVIFKEDHFGLSNYTGTHIHGLLGYEFFNNLAVEIDFTEYKLTVCRPKDLKVGKRRDKIPITIENRKPYVEAHLVLPDGTKKKSKLVVDIGAGHSLSLEDAAHHEDGYPKLAMANLGMGFTGPISGFISRINRIEIGKYKFRHVLTAFPEMDAFKRERLIVKRDGNLGLGILKRFTITLNYQDHAMYLKPTQRFGDPFEHDMSGLEFFAGGPDFRHVIISRVEPGSSGDQAGLQKDDEILSINLKPVSGMSLEEIDEFFKSKNNRSILLEIFRNKKYQNIFLVLKRRI
ncbi:Aspartyl protease [Dyadobacter koreensis]|uniref:Aspartyl protease n=2 Tax=Dyadobacter koreensis TaxID=408657 RepID=A0A1H6YH18_9BACT|nr:Aspartyl protease [Dyadobacter koreensis]